MVDWSNNVNSSKLQNRNTENTCKINAAIKKGLRLVFFNQRPMGVYRKAAKAHVNIFLYKIKFPFDYYKKTI